MPRNAPACQRVYDMGRQADLPSRKASMIGNRSLPVAALILCAACGVTSARTRQAPIPDAARLIERHVVAVGGRERLEAIHSLQIIGILNERGTLHPMFIDRRRPSSSSPKAIPAPPILQLPPRRKTAPPRPRRPPPRDTPPGRSAPRCCRPRQP